MTSTFGELKNLTTEKEMQVICKGKVFEIIEEVGLTSKRQIEIEYHHVIGIAYDHGNSEVKFTIKRADEENYIILTLQNSIEFEQELKLRFTAISNEHREFKVPAPLYMGMFAGASKPKPFQRKRPNQSLIPAGKLPTLSDMRNIAIQSQKGSYKPCTNGESRRMELALQHIYEGSNIFPLLNVRGASIDRQFRSESVLSIEDDCVSFRPYGASSSQTVKFSFEDIVDWQACDNDFNNPRESYIEIRQSTGDRTCFFVPFIRDAKHTLEYFWNVYQVSNGRPVKLGSTHGRPIVSVTTLAGESPASDPPLGQTEVVDQDGIAVRPGTKITPKKSGLNMIAPKEPMIVPLENRSVKKHWHKVVVHTGWLLKKGGVGIGAVKNWIKRFFVLYKTSQGHFLVYYSDFVECPMYTSDKNHRNIVDIAKTTFIRPGSNKVEFNDTPAYSFDIVTTEREWTLCAENQDNMQRWLKILNRAVDEDVAILPDEELTFFVKPKVDPIGTLPSSDYTTVLKVSSNGVSVTCPDVSNAAIEREHYFWVYTDFYKWSLLTQGGKLALLLNVFADSTFTRRNEFIFRTKEAVRLSTAIEYFIEKFMSVMHVRLEVMDEQIEHEDNHRNQENQNEYFNDEDQFSQDVPPPAPSYLPPQQEVDLLDLDSSPATIPVGNQFNVDPFGENIPVASVVSSSVNLFDDDAFTVPVASVTQKLQMASPLPESQIQQHKLWSISVMSNGVGPIYDDGNLQLAVKIDIRGSQARCIIYFRNVSSFDLSQFSFQLVDSANFSRFDPGAADFGKCLTRGSQGQQTVMLECMRPAFPGLSGNLSYEYNGLQRVLPLSFPLCIFTFNEPIFLNSTEFSSRWQQLVTTGLENQSVIYPKTKIDVSVIKQIMYKVCTYMSLIVLFILSFFDHRHSNLEMLME